MAVIRPGHRYKFKPCIPVGKRQEYQQWMFHLIYQLSVSDIMAIKHKLSQAEFDALSDDLKDCYKKDGDGYIVDVSGAPAGVTQADVDKAVSAKNHEKELRLKAERELREHKANGSTTAEEAESLKGEVQKLTERLNSRDSSLKSSAMNGLAEKVAASSKYPSIMLPHVLKRLSADIDESGAAKVSILDKDGKVSTLTIDQLTDEFRKDKEFEGLMLANTSSGAGGGQPGSNGNPGTKQLKDMNEQERVAFAKTDPDGFKAAIAAQTPSA